MRGAPPPSPGDCTTIRLWSNGWHVNLAMRAEHFETNHPFRQLYPDATHFLIGWGERGFYTAENAGFWKGLAAILPPSPAAIQIIASDEPVEHRIWPGKDVVTATLSREGAAVLASSLDSFVQRDVQGAPIVLQQGRVADQSTFVAARGDFHFFNMCNHWTAKRLGEAGVPVSARISFTASGLMNAVSRKTPAACPAVDG